MTKRAEKAFKAHYFSTSDLRFFCPTFRRLERDDIVYVYHLFIVYVHHYPLAFKPDFYVGTK